MCAQVLWKNDIFDATTLQTICREAGISKRTFFRYFRDKESLVFPNRNERLAEFVKFLSKYEQVENPFDALRAFTQLNGTKYNENKEYLLAQQSIIKASPALLAREKEIDRDWEREIAKAFSSRAGYNPDNDLWASVLAGAIMGVVRASMNHWFDRKCEDDLTQIGQDALDYLQSGFPIGVGNHRTKTMNSAVEVAL